MKYPPAYKTNELKKLVNKRITMEDKIQELEAIIVVLYKRIIELEKKAYGRGSVSSDAQKLEDLKKEAQKIKI